jgi:hypothetical protein
MTEGALRSASPAQLLRRRELLWIPLTAMVSAVAGCLVTQALFLRVLLALLAAAVLVVCAVAVPRAVIYGLVVWLFALGLMRRLVGTIGPGGPLDPLLLVGPVVLAALVASTSARSNFRDRTPLANLVLAMSGLLVVSALNPLQGGPLVGLAGLLFTVVPMLAFWIGRAAADDGLVRGVLKLYGGLSLVAAAYGLYQIFIGFPVWDQRWILQGGYAALNVGGVTRAFGTSSSASEYAFFLGVGLVAWFTLTPRRLLALPALGLLGCAIFYESSRGIIFGLALTLALLGAMRRRVPLPLALAAAAIAVVGVIWFAGRMLPASDNDHSTAALTEHQLGGLADPFNPETSTLMLHLGYFWSGFVSGFANPIGHGVGAISIAGAKFGGTSQTTELDPSNMAVAAGLPGLALYLCLAGTGFRRAYKAAMLGHDRLALCAFGVLVAMAFQWLNGGQYSVAILPWFLLGWLDRQSAEVSGPTDPQRPSAVNLPETASCS